MFKTEPTRSNNRNRTKKTNNRKKSNNKNRNKKIDWFGSAFGFEFQNWTKPNRTEVPLHICLYNTMKIPKCPFIPKSLMVSPNLPFPCFLSSHGLTLTHSPSLALAARRHPHHRWIFTAVGLHLLLCSSPSPSTRTPSHHRVAPSRNTTIVLRHRHCTTTANARHYHHWFWRHHSFTGSSLFLSFKNTFYCSYLIIGSSLFLFFKNTPKLLFLCFVLCSYF